MYLLHILKYLRYQTQVNSGYTIKNTQKLKNLKKKHSV